MTARPLLDGGPLEASARAALDRLSAALAPLQPSALPDASLAGGHVGLALAHAYLAPIFPERRHGEAMQGMLDAAMESVASGPSAPSLHSGFVGLAWLVQHLQSDDTETEGDAEGPLAPVPVAEDDPSASVDAELLQWLSASPWNEPFDLIEGLVGVGIYALERAPLASGIALAERVVDRLAEAASREPQGLAWATHREWIPAAFHGDRPERYFDLGLAHGQAGVLGFLGAACARGVAAGRAAPLLERGMEWMLAHRLDDRDAYSRFPTWIVPGRAREPSRDAWCYGDPGIAVALLLAARGANEPSWEAAALDVARHAATRDLQATRCLDAGVCHGAMGDAHIFHRLHRLTGDPLFADRARAYLERGLAFGADPARRDDGVGGFSAWGVQTDGEPSKLGWTPDPGFLTGAAGVALVLAAALAPLASAEATDASNDVGAPGRDQGGDPGWDRVLLTSARGTGRIRRGAGPRNAA